MNDPLKRNWCSRISNGELTKLYYEGEELIKAARRNDVTNAGHGPSELVDSYYLAISKFQQILDSMDWERIQAIKTFRIGHYLKQQAVGFTFGVLASVLASYIYTALQANGPPQESKGGQPLSKLPGK